MPPSYWPRRHKPRPERHGRTSTCRATILGVPANVWRERRQMCGGSAARHVGCTSTCVVPPEPPCWVSRQDTCPKACPPLWGSGSHGVPGHGSPALSLCVPHLGAPFGTGWTQEAERREKGSFTEWWGSRPVQLPAGCSQVRTWSSGGARSRGRTGRWCWRRAGLRPGTAASAQDQG